MKEHKIPIPWCVRAGDCSETQWETINNYRRTHGAIPKKRYYYSDSGFIGIAKDGGGGGYKAIHSFGENCKLYTPEEAVKLIEAMSDEELIEEAKRRYPVGTKFRPAHVEQSSNSYCIITDDSDIVYIDNYVIAKVNGNTYSSMPKYSNTLLSRVLYDKNKDKWAEIISEESTDNQELDLWYCAIHDNDYLVDSISLEFVRLSDESIECNQKFVGFDHTKKRTATPLEVEYFKACMKAGTYVEPPIPTEFEVGKWYKYNGWYIKYSHHEGPIWRSSEEINYHGNHSFVLSSFGGNDGKFLLTDLSEIQQYLPEGHPDKISTSTLSDMPTTLDKQAIKEIQISEPMTTREVYMSFFDQLREPERTQAKLNYNRCTVIPTDLYEAISMGMKWIDTPQGHDYWHNIRDRIKNGTYFNQPQELDIRAQGVILDNSTFGAYVRTPLHPYAQQITQDSDLQQPEKYKLIYLP